MLPAVSVTEATLVTESFHAAKRTFKSPAICAPVNVTVTDVCAVWGVAELLCTNAGGSAAAFVVAVATFE